MRRIFRFQVTIGTDTEITLVNTGMILSAAPSRSDPDNVLDVWYLTNSSGPQVKVPIIVVGTGHPIPDEAKVFISTCVCPNGLVWHVWRGWAE